MPFSRRQPREPAELDTRFAGEASERERRVLLERWRASEQHVWRCWKAWLAAGGDDRGSCYHVLLGAMAEEDGAAAALELVVRMLGANRSASG